MEAALQKAFEIYFALSTFLLQEASSQQVWKRINHPRTFAATTVPRNESAQTPGATNRIKSNKLLIAL